MSSSMLGLGSPNSPINRTTGKGSRAWHDWSDQLSKSPKGSMTARHSGELRVLLCHSSPGVLHPDSLSLGEALQSGDVPQPQTYLSEA